METNTITKQSASRPHLRRSVIRVVGMAAVAAFALTIVGCNATKGLGEDLQESSDNVKNAGKK